MKCRFCGQGMAEGVTLFRLNPKGVKGEWGCEHHIPAGHEPDKETRDIVAIIESANTKRR